VNWIRNGWIAASMLLAAASVQAAKSEHGINVAGVIDFPTALDQAKTHTVHGTLDIFDASAPDLRPVDLRYGLQIGNFQMIADLMWRSQPQAFDHAELKLKLRFLNLDEFRTFVAMGVLGRLADPGDTTQASIDGRPYSLFAVMTVELMPFRRRDPMLLNLYLDNRLANLGFKLPLSDSIRLVLESDFNHVLTVGEPWHHKAGFEMEGEQNFYVQFLYSSVGDHLRVQIGTGF